MAERIENLSNIAVERLLRLTAILELGMLLEGAQIVAQAWLCRSIAKLESL